MRKFISVLLALLLVFSLTTVAFSAYNVVDDGAPIVTDATADYEPLARVYFMMPDGAVGDYGTEGTQAASWYNEFNLADDGYHYAGVYTWSSECAPDSWPGYRMEIDNYDDSVYYADLPGDDGTVNLIFNNGVDGGMDNTLPIYYCAAQSSDLNAEGAYEGDYDTLPYGSYNEMDFDNCIFVVDPDQIDESPLSHKQTCGGNWYYYYGNGCYGTAKEGEDFTSADVDCMNPNHWVDGEHVGYHGEGRPLEEKPTQAPATEAAETEAPATEAPATEAPATEAPATEAPATEAPATEAPEETEAPEPADTYIVAGNATDIFGTAWNGSDANNTMSEAGGVFAKEYTVDAAMNDVQFKVVKNGTDWIGDETGNNVTFNLTGAGTFTAYCDGTKAWVEGDIVAFDDSLTVESVTAVGNGAVDGSNWLNNITWDPAAAANHMAEDNGVYTASYTLGEYDTSDVEFKFAVNDAWTHNFGLADGGSVENGVECDAIYNGSTNIKIEGLAEGTTINMALDLTNFDYATKTGAKMTITWTAPAEPTEAPATEAPETEAPATEAPEETEAPEPADTYIVAGNATDIFGTAWNGSDANNTMSEAGGVFAKEYTVDAAMNDVQFKVVKNGTDWIGDETGNNVTFNLTGAGTFTAYCDGTKAWVEGDIVAFDDSLVVESVTAVGNGSADGTNWLNNITWDPAAAANHMAEDNGVYTASYTLGEYDTSDVEFKFAVNDAWTHNFGLADGGSVENGVECDAIYNGSTNIKIEGLAEGTTIDMALDLTNFDYATKTGAKMTITWAAPAEPTEAPATEAPATEAPATEAPATEAPQPETEPAPAPKPNTLYLIGDIESLGGSQWDPDPAREMEFVEDGLYKFGPVELKKAELGVDVYGNPIKNSDPTGPEIIGDSFKVGKSSKRGTTIATYYPDGVENNRTVPEDGTYTIYFRPNGDGTAEDGWTYVYKESDPEGNPAAHGCTNGGYMYKFVKEGAAEPTEAPATEAPVTEAPATEAPATEAPQPEDTYIVAGNATDIFGTAWNGSDANNAMSEAGGVWAKEYTVDAAMNDVQFKVVKNGTDWIGDETGNNVTFNLTGAGTFTAYCDGTKAWVEGDIVAFDDSLVVESVTAVGNGSADGSNWLNNITWDPAAAANHMAEDNGVYTASYTLGEYDTSNVEFKFAVNDAWTHNFGLADGGSVENGVECDAIYNGSTNIKIEGLAEGTTINMALDLTNFDYATKTGAKMTITWTAPAEPTEAPATEAPETEAPATEAPQPEDTYIVAGNATDIFGTAWNGTDANNTMYYDGELYSRDYDVDGAMDDVQLKVVKNGTDWIGDETGNNVTFSLTDAGTFTVYCDGTKAWVDGEIVELPTDFEYRYVAAVGNGASDGSTWLNCQTWKPDAAENKMLKVADGVYTFQSVIGEYDPSNVEFKFAFDGAWTHNFGLADGGSVENGVETDAIYNGSTNIKIDGLAEGTVVTMTLDLTGFKFASKTGAKMTISWKAPDPEEQIILGDADGDGEVTSIDVALIQRFDAHMKVTGNFNEAAADVDGDGEVTILDATFIQRYLAHANVKYPIGEPIDWV